ncbi:glycoside hydrolase family 130 protein [Companilactobacillus huachuanensis]|uniref:Glycoside hydrolase family 130 protein n=1 Tax=Companilactobacillus huachuanensis TaxID=2559914 RepID=A0ABW1RQH6_9LACO|nr:glycoside hydrolase family 130 protein [Companilactobacillus huachuanensis]
MIKVERYKKNPIITPDMIKPINSGYQVVGAFNAAVTEYKGEILLILRIAERPISNDPNIELAPYFDCETNKTKTIGLDRNSGKYNFDDSRVISTIGKENEFDFLTSISYLRIARSTDGINFVIDDEPFVYPHNEYETFGVEDPRCSKIDNTYYLNFSAVSTHGVCVELISTEDFKSYKHISRIFNPDNKDVALFPEKINGKYYALNRPTVKSTGHNDVWISSSPDLKAFGDHTWLFTGSKDGWDNGRVGAGLPPIKTKYGWLEIYHAADTKSRYCLGAMLLDLNDPTKIVKRLSEPILRPETDYEKNGFFGEVVFSCGATLTGDVLSIYYGVADTSMAVCKFSMMEILNEIMK